MKAGALALGAAALTLGLAIASQAREQKVEGLKPVSAFAGISDPAARSAAIFTEMGKVMQHPRCVNCHPRTDRPLQGDAQQPHDPPVSRGPTGHGMAGLECGTCHGPSNVALTNGRSVPGHPEWHVAPIAMAWEGKTLGQICQQIKDRKRNGGKTLEQLIEHNSHDGLVGWGWNPGPGRAPVPGTQAQFGELTRAWVESGAKCPVG
jgi:hypothetical protein